MKWLKMYKSINKYYPNSMVIMHQDVRGPSFCMCSSSDFTLPKINPFHLEPQESQFSVYIDEFFNEPINISP